MKGFDCEQDPDFCSALRFYDKNNNIYADIKAADIKLREELANAVLEHEEMAERDTDILDIKTAFRKN